MKNQNLMWAGLSVAASKRFDRELILPGRYNARLRISGNFEGEKITEVLQGSLVAGESQFRTSKTKPSTEELAAALLYQLPKSKRLKICEQLAGGLQSDSECKTLVKHLVNSLTKSSTSSIKGSLAFESV